MYLSELSLDLDFLLQASAVSVSRLRISFRFLDRRFFFYRTKRLSGNFQVKFLTYFLVLPPSSSEVNQIRSLHCLAHLSSFSFLLSLLFRYFINFSDIVSELRAAVP